MDEQFLIDETILGTILPVMNQSGVTLKLNHVVLPVAKVSVPPRHASLRNNQQRQKADAFRFFLLS
jgi:hypothetical protein